MRRLTFTLVALVLVLAGVSAPAGASPSDTDNDGVPNRRDLCPTFVGTRRPDGCPTARWRLNDLDGPLPADWSFNLGSLGWAPVAGDWGVNGDSVGAYDRRTGRWHLRSTVCPCWHPIDFTFDVDVPGPHLPIAGDWNGDGTVGVGLYTPSNGTFHLRNDLTTGGPDIIFAFGGPQPGRYARAVAGDWEGDGTDNIGIFRADTNRWRLRTSNDAGPPTAIFRFGGSGVTDWPVVGNWDGDSTLGVGVFDGGTFLLRNAQGTGSPDLVRQFGSRTGRPVAGDWDLDGRDAIGVQGR